MQHREKIMGEMNDPVSNDGYRLREDFPLWEDAEVAAFAGAGTTTAKNYATIMNTVVDNNRVGEWLSIDDLAELTRMKRSEISTFRTHMYRYVHIVFGQEGQPPFSTTMGTEIKSKGDRVVYYWVSEACAEQWCRVGSK